MRRSRVTKALEKAWSISSACSLYGSGIRNAPMRRHRLPRPIGADLTSRFIADREYEVEWGRVRPGEFIPGLAAKIRCAHARSLDLANGFWSHESGGMASCAEGSEVRSAPVTHDRLSHDGAG